MTKRLLAMSSAFVVLAAVVTAHATNVPNATTSARPGGGGWRSPGPNVTRRGSEAANAAGHEKTEWFGDAVVLRKVKPQHSIIHVPPRGAPGGNGTACPDGQAWRASDARCVEAFVYYDD